MPGLGELTRASRVWVGVALVGLTSLGLILVWVLATPSVELRAQLMILQVWSLDVCVGVGLVLAIVVLRDVRRLFDWRDTVGIGGAVAVALALTLGVAPRTSRIFYDEQIYQNVAQNIVDSRLAQMCNDGTIEAGRLHCVRGEYNKQPYAYPHALSLVYRIVGVGPTPAFAVNAVAISLTVCGLYLLVVLLFADRVAAFFAALVLSLTPEHILWSASAAAEPSASLACVAALLSAACFIRTRSTPALVGVAVATAYAIQFRPETFLIVPVVGLLLWQRAREEFTRPRLWWAGVLFLGLVSVHLAHMAAVRNEGWGTTQDRLAFAYVRDNLRVNGWFYLADARFPVAYTVLALLGLSVRRLEPGRLTMACYFLLFWGITLFFYAGSYDYGADVRYSLATFPPLAMLAGLGLSAVNTAIRRVAPRFPAAPAFTAAVLLQFSWYLPTVRATADTAWAARADVQFAESLVADLPERSYVLTHNPTMFQLWGVSAGQMSLAVVSPGFIEDLSARHVGGVFLHWNFWCNVQDPVQPAHCRKVLESRPAELVREVTEQDQRFALYRLTARER